MPPRKDLSKNNPGPGVIKGLQWLRHAHPNSFDGGVVSHPETAPLGSGFPKCRCIFFDLLVAIYNTPGSKKPVFIPMPRYVSPHLFSHTEACLFHCSFDNESALRQLLKPG